MGKRQDSFDKVYDLSDPKPLCVWIQTQDRNVGSLIYRNRQRTRKTLTQRSRHFTSISVTGVTYQYWCLISNRVEPVGRGLIPLKGVTGPRFFDDTSFLVLETRSQRIATSTTRSLRINAQGFRSENVRLRTRHQKFKVGGKKKKKNGTVSDRDYSQL